MPSFYPYLISSLPMLHFATRPPFPFKRLLEICREFIPQNDLQVLLSLPKTEGAGLEDIKIPLVREWVAFDTALRNELVKIRARAKQREPSGYLRPTPYDDPGIAHLALAAHRQLSILEAERLLDQQRWNQLEGLAVGRYFDLDFLIVYAYKLLILERWERINTADNRALLEEALKT